MTKVINVKHWKDGSWTWEVLGLYDGCLYTDKNGEGIFYQDLSGNTRQLAGTCQFAACRTVSGMRRKLKRIYED